MTAGIRQTMHQLTGTHVDVCPWRAFRDPFVGRVLGAMRFFESGQLAYHAPNPSHRLVEGISWYHSVDNRVHGHMLDRDRDERKREADKQRMIAEMGRRRG
jgi:hypothetical protein